MYEKTPRIKINARNAIFVLHLHFVKSGEACEGVAQFIGDRCEIHNSVDKHLRRFDQHVPDWE